MAHQIDPKFGNVIVHGGGFSFGSSPIVRPPLEQIITSPLINIPVPGDVDTGGIIGSLIDIVGGIIGGRGPTTFQFPPAPGGTPPLLPGRIPPGPIAPGSPGSFNGCAPNPCCSGQHLNKSRGCDGSPPGTKCVSNRRMNSLNPKALRRATRRLKGFERAVKGTRKQLRTLARI